MYVAEKKGREGLNIKVLIILLSMSPLLVEIVIPSSEPFSGVRVSSISSLYHVMEGLGLAMAVHSNMASSGWVTVTALSVITGGSGGTAKCKVISHIFNSVNQSLTLNN